jgi:hypothetical protein
VQLQQQQQPGGEKRLGFWCSLLATGNLTGHIDDSARAKGMMRAMAAAVACSRPRAGLGNSERAAAEQRPMLGYLLTYSLTAGDSVFYGETQEELSYTRAYLSSHVIHPT